MAKVTLTDISRETGFSMATVSRVINGTGTVKQDTRQQIMSAAIRLGYSVPENSEQPQPNPRGNVILVCIPAIDNPFYGEIVAGIRKAALNYEYHVLIREGDINGVSLPAFLNTIASSHAIGVITTNYVSVEALKAISSKVPLVQCCEYNSLVNLPYVSVDDYHIGESAVDYLASIGKKRIAFLNGGIRYKYAQHRRAGFEEAILKRGLPEDPSLIINLSEIIPDLAFSAALHLIKSNNPPDAFFAASDVFALAIIRAVTSAGYRVPQDVAVVGCDNIGILAFSTPSITTVNQPRLQLGATATELLAERIRNPSAPVKQITLESELIIREST